MTAPTMTPTHFTTSPNPVPKQRNLPAIPEMIIFSPNGQHLAVGFFDDRRVVHFNGENRATFVLGHPVHSMAIANNGRLVTSCLQRRCIVWTGERHQTIDAESWVQAVAISEDSALVVVGQKNGSCSLYRLQDGMYILHSHFTLRSAITAATLTPSGADLALGTASGDIHLMNIPEQRRSSKWQMNGEIISIALSDEGSRLFARDISNSTRFWTNEATEPLEGLEVALSEGMDYAKITDEGVEICGKNARIVDHPGANQIFISGNGSTVVTICGDCAMIWSNRPPITVTLENPDSCFTMAAVSADGGTIVLADDTSKAITIIQINSK